jgi:hypothetical protein
MDAESLLPAIDAFLARPDVRLSETTFGRLAVNDGKFVPELRAGRRVWPETVKKVAAFIHGYVPPSPRKEGGEARGAIHAEQTRRNPPARGKAPERARAGAR